MGNERLDQAIRRAGLTDEEFADIAGVDAKTVQRWLAGRTPYRRHRLTITRALNQPEHELFDVPAPSEQNPDEPVGVAAGRGDVVAGYGSATDAGAPDPVALIRSARERVDILDVAVNTVLADPDIIAAVLDAADRGIPVHALIGQPASHHRSLLRHAGVEVRLPDGGSNQTIIRVDEQILLGLPIFTEPDQPPPLLHLHRQTDDGLFDRFANLHDALWTEEPEDSNAREELEDQLEYLTETDDDAAGADDEDIDNDEHVPPPSDSHDHPSPNVGRADSQTPRRWPRRPD